MKTSLSIILAACTLTGVTFAAKTKKTSEPRVTITLDVRRSERVISPLFFGVCPTFVSENDAAMADGVMEKHLQEMPCRLLRYPGGTDSDVYVWNTQRLHEQRWPFEDGPKTMDTDEFIALCRRLKAEPLLCVNTEIAHFADLATGVKLAADWVRYCNVEKGYGVKYWEIGNEPYFHTRFTAEEYARLFLAYAKAMKAVDPAIKVAAVGKWNINRSGVKDRIPGDKVLEAQALELKMEAGQRALEEPLEALQTRTNATPWWPKLIEIAGSEIDVASIHWYFNLRELPRITTTINRLQTLLGQKVPGRKIPIAITEWNLYKGEEIYGLERALVVAEAMGRMLDAGVELASYWPLRCNGWHNKRSLLNAQTKQPTVNYVAMQLFAQYAGAQRVASACTDAGLYHFATRAEDGRTVTLFLVNRSAQPRAVVNLVSPGFAATCAWALTLTAPQPQSADTTRTTATLPGKAEAWRVAVPAWSVVVVQLKASKSRTVNHKVSFPSKS